MNIIFLLLLIIICVFSAIKEKNIYNPITLFSGLWSIIFLCASMRLYGMVEYSDKTLIIIASGLLSIVIGILLSRYILNRVKAKQADSSKTYEYDYNFKIIRVVLIIGVIFLLPFLFRVCQLLLSGVEYSRIRMLYYSYGGQSLIENKTLFTVFDWFVNLVMLVLPPIIMLSIFDKKSDKISTILMIVFAAIAIFITGGRIQLIITFAEMIIIFLAKGISIKSLTKRVKVILISIFVLFIAFVVGYTALRSSKSKVTDFYAYPAITIPYFSEVIEKIDEKDDKTYGFATMYGPYLFVQKTIKITTGVKFENSEQLDKSINYPQNHWVKVFGDSSDRYNAFTSLFYNFYLDFRIPGVVIFSTLYGLFIGCVYYSFISNKNNKRFFVAYLLLSYGILISFIKWQFASPVVVLALLAIKIFITKKANNTEN